MGAWGGAQTSGRAAGGKGTDQQGYVVPVCEQRAPWKSAWADSRLVPVHCWRFAGPSVSDTGGDLLATSRHCSLGQL